MVTSTPSRTSVASVGAPSLAEAYLDYEAAFADRDAPFAFVDLDAMWANAEGLISRARKLPIRIASKSVRCRPLLDAIVNRHPRFAGLMTFTLAETLWLANHGFENLLLAYPTADRAALREWARLETERPPAVMVDSVEHLDLIESAAGKPRQRLRICIDIDVSYRPARGRLNFGPLRSPLSTAAQAVEMAREIGRRPIFELVGARGMKATSPE